MPIRSLTLLPQPYVEAAKSSLSEYYPTDFKTDLNGKVLEWEAIILIPFVDERRIIEEEKKILSELELSAEEKLRNHTTMSFYVYRYASLGTGKVLKSTLDHFPDFKQDFSAVEMNSEYDRCGEFCFNSKLLPGVKGPNPSLPSLLYLNVQDIEKIVQNMFRVDFEVFLTKIPQVRAERNPDELQKFIDSIVEDNNRTVFIDFPYQIEARIVLIEDKKSCYQFYEQRGKVKVE
jgi:5'-3' exoribonuclease 1